MSTTTTTPVEVVEVVEVDGVGGGELERSGRLRPLLWRLHFFGGFLAAPIALWLALTGILFAWNPQIEAWLHDDKLTTSSQGEPVPVSEQVEAVMAVNPGHQLIDVTPASGPGRTTGVQLAPSDVELPPFGAPPGAFTVYVDPATAAVTGRIAEEDRPDEWIRNLHSSFRLGDGLPNNLTEVAASWVLVSLATGVYLWWPKTRQALARSLVPRLRGLRGGRRKPWRDLHSTVGILSLLLLVVVVATGLTWTEYAGQRVDLLRDAVNSESPFLATSIGEPEGHGAGEHTASGHGGGSGDDSGDAPVDLEALDRVDATAAASDLEVPYTVSPGASGEAWTVREIESSWPLRQAELAVDPASGDVVDRLELGDKAWLDQATSWGIGFHEGTLLGVANQVLLTMLAVGLVVMIVTGYMAWWRRRPSGALAAPPKPGPLLRTTPIPLLVLFVATMWLLPLLALSFALFLLAEWAIRWLRPGRRGQPAST